MAKRQLGISVKDAVSELKTLIDDADEFRTSELEAKWAEAELYYNGYTSLEEFEGRSTVTKTEVRDSIRNMMPSIMRILASSQRPVVYIPSSMHHGMWVDQQADYVRSLFYKSNGYMQLYSAILEALKLKLGILKVWWEPDPSPDYYKYTKVPMDVVSQLADDPQVDIIDFTASDVTQLGDNSVELYDVEFVKNYENGSIKIEAVPNYEFFISKSASSLESAIQSGVHGQRANVTVDEAIKMGLDYDNWEELDSDDPETSDHANSSMQRRGYALDGSEDESEDIMRHVFLLTESYASYDLDGDGRTQLYRFYLGGTSYKYLHHERVTDSPFALITPIPIPFSVYGHSIVDLTINEQDTSTSLLRAAVDNAHASNDAKFIGDPSKIEFDDLMNPAINAPVRARQGATVQMVQVPFTAQGVMSVLQYLDADTQNKVGITKAAQGLDPDAMQSTDRQAVMNTIQTSQGQTELIVRNIIETGLIRAFRLLLRLSIAHQSPYQMMLIKGKSMPVDTRMFDPDAVAQPNVGLGMASGAQKQQTLGTIVIPRIEAYLDKYGPNNPFTSYTQLYNALEDFLEASGVYNTERYFNVVTPQVEQAWATAQQKQQQLAAEKAQQAANMDPSKAFMQVEQQKREIDRLRVLSEARRSERQLELDALTEEERLNLERDKLAQDRIIKLAELGQKQEDAKIKKEQKENDVSISSGSGRSGKEAGGVT